MNPLNPMVLESWARLTHHAPNALEVDALFRLDDVLRNPSTPKDQD